jgi:hypothetical protein
MRSRANPRRPSESEDYDSSSHLAQLRASFDADDDRRRQDDELRLVAERDPAQREAFRRADAQQRAEYAQAEAQFRASTRQIFTMTAIGSRGMGKAERRVRRVHNRLSALKRIADQAKEARDTRLISYRLVVESTVTTILRQQHTLAMWRVRSAADCQADPPPQLLDIGAVISAPRPGPHAGTALAA